MVTVEEIWRLALPEGTELVGGATGLGAEVKWAVTLRATSPGFAALRGGELAIISLHALRMLDPNLTLSQALSRLAEKRVAATAIEGQVDDSAVQRADQLGLPLFGLPAGVTGQDVDRATTRFIVDRQSELYRRSEEIRRHLTELAIEGRGNAAIAEALGRITGLSVCIEDAEGDLLLYVTSPVVRLDEAHLREELHRAHPALRESLPTKIPSASDPPAIKLALNESSLVRIVAPISGHEGIESFLSLLGPRDSLWEPERMAVSRGASACAIEASRKRAALEAQDRLQLHFLDDVLRGQFGSEDDLRERARRLGYDLTVPYLVFAMVAVNDGTTLRFSDTSSATADLTRAMKTELSRRGVDAPLRVADDRLAVLYPSSAVGPSGNVKKFVKSLLHDLSFATNGAAVSVGIGALHEGVRGLKRAYEEATQALVTGNRLFGHGHITAFGDLGLYRLLFSIRNADELRSFYRQMLGRLVEYDARNSAELVKTLDAYFASGNSPTTAADILHLHRNTLIYRLQRIHEITGLDLDDPETRLCLHLALRIGDVLVDVAGGGAGGAKG